MENVKLWNIKYPCLIQRWLPPDAVVSLTYSRTVTTPCQMCLRTVCPSGTDWAEVGQRGLPGFPWVHTFMTANCPWAWCWAETQTSLQDGVGAKHLPSNKHKGDEYLSQILWNEWLSTQHTKSLILQCQRDVIIWVWGKYVINLIFNRMLDMTKQSRRNQLDKSFSWCCTNHSGNKCLVQNHWNMSCPEGNWGKMAVSISS